MPKSKFQIIILVVFVIFIVAGLISFSLYKGGSGSNKAVPITIWGTFPADIFNQYVSDINLSMPSALSITYVEKNPNTFSNDFVEALARGIGPDAILITADMLLSEEDKLAIIPFSALDQRSFMNTYVDEANIYAQMNGYSGIPFTLDPLVMYWNRDIFNSAGIAIPPQTWSDVVDINKLLLLKDQNGNIRKSGIAMGEFNNITNARELLGTLFLQVGNPVTTFSDNTILSTIKQYNSASPIPALQYFTQFVDPTNANYSWNRGLPNDKTAFLSGMLATYFGFASELSDIRSKNPNLNFDIVPVPQLKSGGEKAVYGKMFGFSLVRNSSNVNAAYGVILTLVLPQYLSTLSQKMYLPSVRRDVIAKGTTDPYISIFNQSALVAKTWLDVDPIQSKQVFSDLVDSVTSGQKTISDGLQNAGNRYDVLLKNATQ